MRLSGKDIRGIRELVVTLRTLEEGTPPACVHLIPALKALLDAEIATSYHISLDDGAKRWRLNELVCEGLPQKSMVEAISWREQPTTIRIFDPRCPDAWQQNHVFDARMLEKHDPEAVKSMRNECFRLFGLPWGGDQLRVLICDGSVLLKWVGVYRAKPSTSREHRILSALVQPIQRRLKLERHLHEARFAAAALEATLEAIPSAAFVCSPSGQLRYANAVAQQRLAEDRQLLREVVGDDLDQATARGRFTISQIVAPGLPRYLLVVEARPPRDPVPLLAQAGARWKLTPRQKEVLSLLAQGYANKEIAAHLGCSESTIEAHLTAIFRRTGYDSRASLIAALWSKSQ